MCVSCGCGHPDDDHGDSRNITLNMLNQAAIAAGTTRDKMLQNIMDSAQSDSSNTDSSQQSQQPAYNQAQAQQERAGIQGQPGSDNQSDNQQNNYGQVYNQPGTQGTTQGQESGTAWRQDAENVNYTPPQDPGQEPQRQ